MDRILLKFKYPSTTRGGATIKLVDQLSVQQPRKISSLSSSSCIDCCADLASQTVDSFCTGEAGVTANLSTAVDVGAACTSLVCNALNDTAATYSVGRDSIFTVSSLPPPQSPCCRVPESRKIPSAPASPPLSLTPIINKNIKIYEQQYKNAIAEDLDWSAGSYVDEEPADNFISFDDAKIEQILLRIGREQQLQAQQTKTKCTQSLQYEIIDLLDNDEEIKQYKKESTVEMQKELKVEGKTKKQQNLRISPDICLIPKFPNPIVHQRIIAQIDLDSTDSEENNEEELPLAATSVSCELNLDKEKGNIKMQNASDEKLAKRNMTAKQESEEEIDIFDIVGEYTPDLRWKEFPDQKSRNLYECLLCGKKVQSNYNLRRHMMIHTGERPFGCDLCDRRFREFSDLKKHRKRHANEADFICMICHKNRPTDHDSIRCSKCEIKNLVLKPQTEAIAATKMAKTMPKLRRQSSKLHESTFEPTTSPQIPTPMENRNKHTLTETFRMLDTIPSITKRGRKRRAFECPLCQRKFGTRHNLKRHLMIHTGEKPFSCNKCRKPFREYSTLKKHMVTHQRDRWYKCLRCPQKYRDFLEYFSHKKIHSDWNGSLLPSCNRTLDYGSDDDNDDGQLSSPDNWLECCECGDRFTDIDTFTVHIRQHDSHIVYQYECYICEESFGERETLEIHMRTHQKID